MGNEVLLVNSTTLAGTPTNRRIVKCPDEYLQRWRLEQRNGMAQQPPKAAAPVPPPPKVDAQSEAHLREVAELKATSDRLTAEIETKKLQFEKAELEKKLRKQANREKGFVSQIRYARGLKVFGKGR